ncbi:MAG: hemolysin family protein [Paenibacillaceae bacterium]
MIALNFALLVILLMATAFFVATEFAIVKLRSSRVEQLVMEGKKNALAISRVISNLDGYLSACQLGITITALGLGWLGEPTFERVIHPLIDPLQLPGEVVSFISFALAFLCITFLHVVVGELAPKTVAIQKTEEISLLFAPAIIFFYKVLFPFIWVLNNSANRFVSLFGIQPAMDHDDPHSEEELQIILSESYMSGKINKSEYSYVSRIFAFDELHAREIMVPRTDMICLDIDNTLADNLRIIREEQYTRFPVIQGNKDNIVGTINTKQFFLNYNDHAQFELKSILQVPVSVTEVIAVKDLLKQMQINRTHIAILVDEYGGTSGMITIEDILEEIVGEIRDEFDEDEKKEIEVISESHIIVDGKTSIIHVNELLHVEIESDGLDTIGGWLYGYHSEIKKNVPWNYRNLIFNVLEKEKHRIRKVDIQRI